MCSVPYLGPFKNTGSILRFLLLRLYGGDEGGEGMSGQRYGSTLISAGAWSRTAANCSFQRLA